MAQKIVIQNVRFSYAHVFQPYSFDDKEPRYSVTILIPKTVNGRPNPEVGKIRKAIEAACEEAKSERWGGRIPKVWFNPLQDGDEPDRDGEDRGEAYAGHYFINAKSRVKPGVVDKQCQPILSTDEFYSGCYGHVSVAFSGFENSGNKGISAFLNNVMKTADGDPLGSGASTAESDFAGLYNADDDDL